MALCLGSRLPGDMSGRFLETQACLEECPLLLLLLSGLPHHLAGGEMGPDPQGLVASVGCTHRHENQGSKAKGKGSTQSWSKAAL